MKTEQKTWNKFGKIAPYYSVLVAEEFKPENLSAENLATFFDSGNEHVSRLMEMIREFRPQFTPQTAVDFGCGVGRVTLALAKISSRVLAVDVSESMLEEARKNCSNQGANNVTFMTTADFLRQPDASADFVHSFIVLQHIRPSSGYQLIQKLISTLQEGGIGAIHVTFSDKRPLLRRLLSRIKTSVPGAVQFSNLLRGRPFNFPVMPMYSYRVDRVFRLLCEGGCQKVTSHFTEHGAHVGSFLIFEKSRRESS
jgi:ubiquinone/menaquinone biosynthesis C-methylase UbiE